MKLKRNGKEYDYDYKNIVLKGLYYKRLKKLADEHNLPLGKMINKLVEDYDRFKTR